MENKGCVTQVHTYHMYIYGQTPTPAYPQDQTSVAHEIDKVTFPIMQPNLMRPTN